MSLPGKTNGSLLRNHRLYPLRYLSKTAADVETEKQRTVFCCPIVLVLKINYAIPEPVVNCIGIPYQQVFLYLNPNVPQFGFHTRNEGDFGYTQF